MLSGVVFLITAVLLVCAKTLLLWHRRLLFAKFDIFEMQMHCILINIEGIFHIKRIVSVFFGHGSRLEEWIQNERQWPLIRHRILLTPVMGNHQLFGRSQALVLSRCTPPNILLIDFRETVSRRADEVTNWLKQLIPRARSPCSFGLVCCTFCCSA